MPGVSQAYPLQRHGGFVAAGAAAELESGGGGPLRVEGASRSIEAGWLFPGGSIFLYEVGLLGSTAVADETEQRSLAGGFFGVRADLLESPRLLGLMPFVRGGLFAGQARGAAGDRLALGPYFALGLSRRLFAGIGLALIAHARAGVAPFSLALGGMVALTVQ